jgi:tRNA A-37 threonylcarbamoyl transferase component Bud32
MKAFQVGALDSNLRVVGMSYARNQDEVTTISNMYELGAFVPVVLDIEVSDQFRDFALPVNHNYTPLNMN